MQAKMFEDILEGKGPEVPPVVLWHSWSEGRGLVAVANKETSDLFCQEIDKVSWRGMTFRAWHRQEFSEGRLVTGHLMGTATQRFKGDQIMRILFSQNKLQGQHKGVKVSMTTQGTLIRFFADPELWEDLLRRRPNQEGNRVDLTMAWVTVRFNLSRNLPEAAGEPPETSPPQQATGGRGEKENPT